MNPPSPYRCRPAVSAFRILVCSILAAAAEVVVVPSPATAEEIAIEASIDAASGRPIITGRGETGRVHRLEFARDALGDWTPIFAAPGGSWSYLDDNEGHASGGSRFYRGVATVPPSLVPHASWKTAIRFPDDPFLSDPLAEGQFGGDGATPVRWVKFTIFLDDLTTVIFQDSTTYPFHYNFAVERLAPFAGATLEEYHAATLHRAGQRAIAGAVLIAPEVGEFGIQFAGLDPYPRELIRHLCATVAAAIEDRGPEVAGYYVPTYEQGPGAGLDRDYFAAHGFPVASMGRWLSGNACYTEGWAVGRLRFVPAGEIETAYLQGDLLSTDILVTDAVPAEVPFVAGILSLEPSTPNSHVAILSQSYGIPFVYLADEALAAEAVQLAEAGRDAVLRVVAEPCSILLVDGSGLDPVFRAQLLAAKQPPPVDLRAIEPFGEPTFDRTRLDAATRDDLRFVGGKAANFGLLRRTIPDTSPGAVAFTFDLWADYLAQPLPGTDLSLGEAVSQRLANHAWPPDIRTLDADLTEIREWFTDVADFTAPQQAAILTALSGAGFDPARKIRFRSSTNVEDTATFVGAGLYDSYSGCLADDTDGDDEGPSHCDPSEPKERGVFRALRKVYASFYNRNAFLERLRRGVDESRVGMAVLVHHSYPDPFEAANGVATARLAGTGFVELATRMVSQVGAVSVTNPEGGALPEVVDLSSYRSDFGSGTSVSLRQPSNLIVLGEGTVLAWEDDYRAFNEMFFELALAYRASIAPSTAPFTLEFEYKKLVDGSLEVKQVRQVPDGAEPTEAPPALVNQPTSLRLFQGEYGDVFANHRLKSAFFLECEDRWLADEGLSSSPIVASTTVRHDGNGTILTNPLPIPLRDGHRFTVEDPGQGGTFELQESWTESSGPGGAGESAFDLTFAIPWWFSQGNASSPVLVLADFESRLEVVHPVPQHYLDWDGTVRTRTEDSARLEPGTPNAPPGPGSTLQRRQAASAGLSFDVGFWWPLPPSGIVAGYTAPLEAWETTTISGLTAEPLVLRDWFAQTYRPGHHNFTEEFLFEPALDPAASETQLQELAAADIRAVYLFVDPGSNQSSVFLVGLDGRIRAPK